jgi:hypothetical protein
MVVLPGAKAVASPVVLIVAVAALVELQLTEDVRLCVLPSL